MSSSEGSTVVGEGARMKPSPPSATNRVSKAPDSSASASKSTADQVPNDDADEIPARAVPSNVNASISFEPLERPVLRRRITQALSQVWDRVLQPGSIASSESSIGGYDSSSTSASGLSRPASIRRDSSYVDGETKDKDFARVDAVVVENHGTFKTFHASRGNHPGAEGGQGGAIMSRSVTLPEARSTDLTAQIDNDDDDEQGTPRGGEFSDGSSFIEKSPVAGNRLIFHLVHTVQPRLSHFFSPKFVVPETELSYGKEAWCNEKRSAIYGALFFLTTWVINASLLPSPRSNWMLVSQFGLSPLFVLPLVVMVVLDWPARRGHRIRFCIYQIWLCGALWTASSSGVIDMRLCDYYVVAKRHCGTRNFQQLFFECTAPPVVALFALRQTRAMALLGFVFWFILVCGAIVPQRVSFIRNIIIIFVFDVFLLVKSYNREINDRRIFTLRNELKAHFRLKQKAESNERKAADASKRFSNYIFHEVRVPLNTALLAVQNLHAGNAIDRGSEQAVEFTALDTSLSTMSTVLNDVLDFNRMQRGGFSAVSRPFSLHRVLRSVATQLELDAKARGLSMTADFDPRVDEVACKAAWQDHELPEIITEGDGILIGDEMRLRQIVTNLASNACKFTEPGGKVELFSELIYPTGEYKRPQNQNEVMKDEIRARSDSVAEATLDGSGIALSQSQQGHPINVKPTCRGSPGEVVVVRIELAVESFRRILPVGIYSRHIVRYVDLTLRFKYALTSDWALQTEIGKMQRASGTGLGLSLCRQIVTLLRGRLGVISKRGQGSTFWVEMPFQAGPQTRDADPTAPYARVNQNRCPLELSLKSSAVSLYPGGGFEFGQRRRSTVTSLASDRTSSARNGTASERSTSPTIYPVKEQDFAVTPSPSTSIIPLPSTSLGVIATSLCSPGVPIPSPDLGKCTPSAAEVPPSAPSLPLVSPSLGSPLLSSLPLCSSPLASPSFSSSPNASPKIRGKVLNFQDGPVRILVVDDDALTRKLMGRLLSRLQGGFEVDTANDGQHALEMILSPEKNEDGQQYEIIFLDNQMPRMTGLEVVQRLRELGRDILVIGITANAQRDDQLEYLSKGANHVLTKPVGQHSLEEMLKLADERRTVISA